MKRDNFFIKFCAFAVILLCSLIFTKGISARADVKLDGTYTFGSLEWAIVDAKEGSTLTLTEDMKLNDTFIIEKDKNIILDLGGHKLSIEGQKNVISNKGRLKIINSGEPNYIMGDSMNVIVNIDGGILDIASSNITIGNSNRNQTTYCLANEGTSVMTISENAWLLCERGITNSGTLFIDSGRINTHYEGVRNKFGGKLTVNSGLIAPDSGDAINNLSGGTAEIYGSVMITTKSSDVEDYPIKNSGTMTISLNKDGIIYNNYSGVGKYVAIYNEGTLTLAKGIIEAGCIGVINQTDEMVTAASFKMTGGTIAVVGDCGTSKYAIGLYSDSQDSSKESSVEILGGTIDSTGGDYPSEVNEYYGISARYTKLRVSGTTIYGKHYGIYLRYKAVLNILSIDKSEIVSSIGKGIDCINSTVNMAGGTVSGGTYGIRNKDGNVNVLYGTVNGKEYGIYALGQTTVGSSTGVYADNPLISSEGTGIFVGTNGTLVFSNGKIRGINGSISGDFTSKHPFGYKLIQANETVGDKVYKYASHMTSDSDMGGAPETEKPGDGTNPPATNNNKKRNILIVVAIGAGILLITLLLIPKSKGRREF